MEDKIIKNNKIKILLINPPEDEKMLLIPELRRIEPPLGLCYLAAVLEKRNFNVEIIDSPALNLTTKDFPQIIKEKKPNLVGITSTTFTLHRALDTATIIKKMDPSILIILGGPHASALPEKTLIDYPVFDMVCIGEGEETIVELADAIALKKNFKNIKGIAYRDKKTGKIIRTAPRPMLINLDTLPFPARHLLPSLKIYKPQVTEYFRLPSTSMITTRGCPFNCIFCSNSVFGRTFRAHSPEYVIKEILHLINKYKVKEIRFVDDNFTLDKVRVHKICDLILENKLDITWSCEARVDRVDSELLTKMKRAGCWEISFGIESGDAEVLKVIKKGIRLDEVEKAVYSAKKIGLNVRGLFMLGHFTETKETIQTTINFAKKLPFDIVQFSLTKAHPGTYLFKKAYNYGEIIKSPNKTNKIDWAEVARKGYPFSVFIPKGLSLSYLQKMQKYAHLKFYLRFSYILSQIKKLRYFYYIRNIVKALIILIKMIFKSKRK